MKATEAPEFPPPPEFVKAPASQATGVATAKPQPKIEVCYTNMGHYIPKSALIAARASAAIPATPPPDPGAENSSQSVGNQTPSTSFQRQSTGSASVGQQSAAAIGDVGSPQVPNILPDSSSITPRQNQPNKEGHQHYQTDSGATGTLIFRKPDPKLAQPQVHSDLWPLAAGPEGQTGEQKQKKKKTKKAFRDGDFGLSDPNQYYQGAGFTQPLGLGTHQQFDPQYYDPSYDQYDAYGYQGGYQEPGFNYVESQGFENQDYYHDSQYQAWQDPANIVPEPQQALYPDNTKKRKGKQPLPHVQRSELESSAIQELPMSQVFESSEYPSNQRRISESQKRKAASGKDPVSKTAELLYLHRKYENLVRALTAELETRGISLKILMKIDPLVFSANCASDIARIQKHVSTGDEAEDHKIRTLIGNVHKRIKTGEAELERIRASFVDKNLGSNHHSAMQPSKLATKLPKPSAMQGFQSSTSVSNSQNWKNSNTSKDHVFPTTGVLGMINAQPATTSPIHIPLVAANPKIGINSTLTTGNYGTYILKPSKVPKPALVQPAAVSNPLGLADDQLPPNSAGFGSQGQGSLVPAETGPSVSRNEQRKTRLRLPDQSRVDMIAAVMSEALPETSSGWSAPSDPNSLSLQDQHSMADTGSEYAFQNSAISSGLGDAGATPESTETHLDAQQTSWGHSSTFMPQFGGLFSGFGISSQLASPEHGTLGKSSMNKTQIELQGQSRSNFNLFSKPAPQGRERSLLKRVQARGSGQPSDFHRGADSVYDQLPLGHSPQEEATYGYYPGTIAEAQETYPQSHPSNIYQAGGGAPDFYDPYQISTDAHAGYGSPQYNERIHASKGPGEDPYPLENHALQASTQEVIGLHGSAINPTDSSQNAPFESNMDRNTEFLDTTEQQSAFEREPEDDEIHFDQDQEGLSKTVQAPAIYPDLSNTEPRDIEKSDGNSNGLSTHQKQEPSGHPSVQEQKCDEPLHVAYKNSEGTVSESNNRSDGKQSTETQMQRVTNTGTRADPADPLQPDSSAGSAPATYHPIQRSENPQPQVRLGDSELQSLAHDMSTNSQCQVEKKSQVVENLRPSPQNPLGGNGSLTVRDSTTTAELNSTPLETSPGHQILSKDIKFIEKKGTPRTRDFGRDWTKDEISKMKKAGQHAAEAVKRACSKALENAASKRQTKKGLESMWSQINNPKRLPLHQLCTEADYSTNIQRWLNRAKEAEKIEFLYEIKPHMLHILTNYIGKLLLHTLFTMSSFFSPRHQSCHHRAVDLFLRKRNGDLQKHELISFL